MILRLVIFLLVNFGALFLGGLFTGPGVSSEWYANLNRAPWTPPGWFFGVAWTTIMLCFSIYLAVLWPKIGAKNSLITLFSIQFVLNVLWNPTFFHLQKPLLALFLIVALTILVLVFIFKYWSTVQWYSLLLFPYALWLIVATSLNLYIVLKN